MGNTTSYIASAVYTAIGCCGSQRTALARGNTTKETGSHQQQHLVVKRKNSPKASKSQQKHHKQAKGASRVERTAQAEEDETVEVATAATALDRSNENHTMDYAAVEAVAAVTGAKRLVDLIAADDEDEPVTKAESRPLLKKNVEHSGAPASPIKPSQQGRQCDLIASESITDCPPVESQPPVQPASSSSREQNSPQPIKRKQNKNNHQGSKVHSQKSASPNPEQAQSNATRGQTTTSGRTWTPGLGKIESDENGHVPTYRHVVSASSASSPLDAALSHLGPVEPLPCKIQPPEPIPDPNFFLPLSVLNEVRAVPQAGSRKKSESPGAKATSSSVPDPDPLQMHNYTKNPKNMTSFAHDTSIESSTVANDPAPQVESRDSGLAEADDEAEVKPDVEPVATTEEQAVQEPEPQADADPAAETVAPDAKNVSIAPTTNDATETTGDDDAASFSHISRRRSQRRQDASLAENVPMNLGAVDDLMAYDEPDVELDSSFVQGLVEQSELVRNAPDIANHDAALQEELEAEGADDDISMHFKVGAQYASEYDGDDDDDARSHIWHRSICGQSEAAMTTMSAILRRNGIEVDREEHAKALATVEAMLERHQPEAKVESAMLNTDHQFTPRAKRQALQQLRGERESVNTSVEDRDLLAEMYEFGEENNADTSFTENSASFGYGDMCSPQPVRSVRTSLVKPQSARKADDKVRRRTAASQAFCTSPGSTRTKELEAMIDLPEETAECRGELQSRSGNDTQAGIDQDDGSHLNNASLLDVFKELVGDEDENESQSSSFIEEGIAIMAPARRLRSVASLSSRFSVLSGANRLSTAAAGEGAFDAAERLGQQRSGMEASVLVEPGQVKFHGLDESVYGNV